MILRRYKKHVTDQNWFAVGLDVIVVIVAIFLGMQVTEWNEVRQDRIKEGEYLLRVKDDIDQMLLDQLAELAFKSKTKRQIYLTLSFLEAGRLKKSQIEAFENGLLATGNGLSYTSLKYQIPSLQNSSESALITNRELRVIVRNHDEDMKKIQAIDQASIEIATQLFIEMTRMFTWVAAPPDLIVGETNDAVRYDFEKLIEDNNLYRRLSVFYGNFKSRELRTMQARELTESLLEEIEDEIKIRGF